MPAATAVTAKRKLSTTEEVAEYLGVKPRALVDWRCRGVGPTFIRLGRLVRYRPEDVETFLREHEGQGYDTGVAYSRA